MPFLEICFQLSFELLIIKSNIVSNLTAQQLNQKSYQPTIDTDSTEHQSATEQDSSET